MPFNPPTNFFTLAWSLSLSLFRSELKALHVDAFQSADQLLHLGLVLVVVGKEFGCKSQQGAIQRDVYGVTGTCGQLVEIPLHLLGRGGAREQQRRNQQSRGFHEILRCVSICTFFCALLSLLPAIRTASRTWSLARSPR